jgi:hypothetical protein
MQRIAEHLLKERLIIGPIRAVCTACGDSAGYGASAMAGPVGTNRLYRNEMQPQGMRQQLGWSLLSLRIGHSMLRSEQEEGEREKGINSMEIKTKQM